MESKTPDSTWICLRLPPAGLREARLQCHHAIQINTRLARGFVPAQSDDRHTSLTWDAQAAALMGQPFSAGGRELRAGLRLRDLTLLFDGLVFPLDRGSFNEALDWLGDQLRARGLDPAPLAQPIHFELDDHPLLHGARFAASSCARELEELTRYYGNAAACIGEVHAPVRCWPHHFDIAVLLVKGEHSLGVGMSPGDASYAEPYFYVSPWPAPAADQLPVLQSRGHWHTEGWTGAVLTASQFAGDDSQEPLVRAFIEDAVAACGVV
jgi:hypothetical protein